jgi:RNA polymerase sigma-70 factor (ECF subfamily)
LTLPDEPSDQALTARAVKGEQAAFATLMRRHKGWLYRFVRRYVTDGEEAYDVLQESFASAWAALSRYDPDRPFEIWLRRIALNKCRDRARREAVRRAFGLSRRGPEETESVADSAASADQTLATGQAMKALEQAIAALPSALKEPLVLTVLEGLSHRDAGELLGLSAKAVEVRVYRAKRQLAETLDRDAMGALIQE